MAPKCLPLELLFEIVPFIPAENAAPNAISSCLLLHNLLLPRVIKWKETKIIMEEMQKMVNGLRDEIHGEMRKINKRLDGFEDRFAHIEGEIHAMKFPPPLPAPSSKTSSQEVHTTNQSGPTGGGGAGNVCPQQQSQEVRVPMPPPMPLHLGRYMDFEIGSSAAFDVRNNTSSEMQHPSLAYSTVSTPFRRNLAKTANPVQILSPINPFSGISFGYSVPSITSPNADEKVSLSTAIRQGRLDNPSVDSAIKPNFEKSKKAHFYIHADNLNSLLCKFAAKVRNERIEKTTLTIAISEFEAQFTHTLEETKSVLNVLHSSIDAEEAAKLKQIVQTLSKWALHIHEKAENVSKVSTIGNLLTPLSGGLQHLVSESRGQLPRGTDANAQQRALQRQLAKPNGEFDVDFGHDLITQNVGALLKEQRSALADPPMQLIPQHLSEPTAPQRQHEKAKSDETSEAASDRKENTEKRRKKQSKEFAAAAGLTSGETSEAASNRKVNTEKRRKKPNKIATAGLTQPVELDNTASIVPTVVQRFRRTVSETGNGIRGMRDLVLSLTTKPSPGI